MKDQGDGNAARSAWRRRAVLLGAVVFTGVVFSGGPRWIAAGLNPTLAGPVEPAEGPVPADSLRATARRLHRTLTVADLHADALLWDVPFDRKRRGGHLDLPRLAEGRIAVQTMSVVTSVPWGANLERNAAGPDMVTALALLQLWPPATWISARARATHQADKLRRIAAASGGRLSVLTTRDELDAFLRGRASDEGTIGAILALEGTQALEGRPVNVGRLHAEGFRMMGLAHLFDNEVGGSAHGLERGGLTRVGRQVLDEMERLGMILDLAHASPTLIDDVLARWRGPLVVSHTGVAGTCPGPRNLDDDRLRAIGEAGGLVGIGVWPDAVCGSTPADWARAVRYAANRIGADQVALGSDWEGAVPAIVDAADTLELTRALLDAGFGADEVRGIMGENTIRVLRAGLP